MCDTNSKNEYSIKEVLRLNSDLYLLSKMIHAEAEGEPFLGKVAVGAVIVNRLHSPLFPKSIKEIIYQPRQFSPIADGRFNSITLIQPESVEAAQLSLKGEDPTGGALYFYNPDKVSANSWIRTRPIIYIIGNHVFCS